MAARAPREHRSCTDCRVVATSQTLSGGTVWVGRSLHPRSFVGRPRRYAAVDSVYPSVFFSHDLTELG